MTAPPKPRLVIDTNIVVPGVLGATASPPRASASAGLLRAWRAGFCSVVVSEDLLAEYLHVLQRPAFGVSRHRALRLCAQVAARAIVVVPQPGRQLLRRHPCDACERRAYPAPSPSMAVT